MAEKRISKNGNMHYSTYKKKKISKKPKKKRQYMPRSKGVEFDTFDSCLESILKKKKL